MESNGIIPAWFRLSENASAYLVPSPALSALIYKQWLFHGNLASKSFFW